MKARIDWSAVFWAAIIAGVVFMMLQMILVDVIGGKTLWVPPRMVAGIVMGPHVVPPPANFDLGVMLVAMLVHFMMSLIYAAIFAWLVSFRSLGLGWAIVAGIVYGLVIYLVDFYIFTGIWPWFAMARNWITVFDHAMFGLVLGWAYYGLSSRRTTVEGA